MDWRKSQQLALGARRLNISIEERGVDDLGSIVGRFVSGDSWLALQAQDATY